MDKEVFKRANKLNPKYAVASSVCQEHLDGP